VKLFLGTDAANWLEHPGPSMMVSLNRMPGKRSYSAVNEWFLDSGGFTELQQHGMWRTTPQQHVDRVRAQTRHGKLAWCSPQDWMCEPAVIHGGTIGRLHFVGTGLSVHEHQHRTIENLNQLRELAPDLPFIPVLQGWNLDDYHHHVDLYHLAGIDLAKEPLVGVGSICRRQATPEATAIIHTLHDRGLRLHGFGFKSAGIKASWPWLTSADSMAWSYTARAAKRSCGRPNGRGGTVKSCNHCFHEAEDWYQRICDSMECQLDIRPCGSTETDWNIERKTDDRR